MTFTHRLILYIILTNAGGQGKTTLARIIKALHRMLCEPVQLLDGDSGNGAIQIIDTDVKRVGWGAAPTLAPDIVEKCAGMHVVFDLGANAMASGREIVDLVPELQAQFKEANYDIIVVAPVTPNKPGASGALKELLTKFPLAKRFFVLNDADKSSNFEDFKSNDAIVNLKHLSPGFLALANECGSSFDEVVSNPPEDYTEASKVIAEWMRDFAQQMSAHGLFENAVRLLNGIPKPISPLMFSTLRKDQVTNTKLRENQKKSKVVQLIDDHGWSAQGLREAATIIDKAEHD